MGPYKEMDICSIIKNFLMKFIQSDSNQVLKTDSISSSRAEKGFIFNNIRFKQREHVSGLKPEG